MKWCMLGEPGSQVRYDFSEASWAFYNACYKDKALGAELARLPETDTTAIAAFAGQQGFVTTPEEIAQFQVANEAVKAYMAAHRPANDELTDAELDAITGGGVPGPACDGCQLTTQTCSVCP
jgi:hypothetical protein